jgi:uncharacterized protein (DUF58 family)
LKVFPPLAEVYRALRDRLWSWSGPDRRLFVEVPGRWYLLLCIALGVVAVLSGNNVLLLLESLLLGGLILSGILSEWTVARVQITLRRGPAYAAEPAQDEAWVKSRSFLPLFCVEIGQWHSGRFITHGFLPLLMPGEARPVAVRPRFENRGEVITGDWGVATAFPFGLARKVRLIEEEGRRLVWPARRKGRHGGSNVLEGRRLALHRRGATVEPEVSDGEVRPWVWDDDARDLVWSKGQAGGEWVTRVRRPRSGAEEQLFLDLAAAPGPLFEERVSALCSRISQATGAVALTIKGRDGSQVKRGRRAALDALAVAQAEDRGAAS